MACYISSNENRFYAVPETTFGLVTAPLAADRFPAIRLEIHQQSEQRKRRDKTGSRTNRGFDGPGKRHTAYALTSYLLGGGSAAVSAPGSILYQAALGAEPRAFSGGTVASVNGRTLACTVAHGLQPGQAIAYGGELRFVANVPDANSVELTAPFTEVLATGAELEPAATFAPGPELPSFSLFDYWTPQSTVQRVLAGAAVDVFELSINGDFHEVLFAGPAVELADNATLAGGQAGLTAFPPEPEAGWSEGAPIPGHLGQIWLGTGPDRFHTVVSAKLRVKNNLEARNREFGSALARCFVPGERQVTFDFTLYARDSSETMELYEAARARNPISVMLQLGNTGGHLCGVYIKSLIPVVPDFDDREVRLQWRFEGCTAQGGIDDEVYVAFA